MMKTTIHEADGKIIAILEGELDTAAAASVEKEFQPLFNNEGRDIFIDCTQLSYIASSGLRILLSILKSAKAKGSRVVLQHVNDDIMNVFRMTGFNTLFEFES